MSDGVGQPGTDLRRVAVFANPATRRSSGSIVARLAQLAPPNCQVEAFETTGAPLAVEEVDPRVAAADALIAVGGDGTVGDVAELAIQLAKPLGIVPAGSTNVIAKGFGIPNSVDHAVRLIFGRHQRHRIDIGMCNGRPFLHMAGAGFDSRMFDATNPAVKRRIGWLAYIGGAATAVRAPSMHVRVRSEAGELDTNAQLVLVANGSFIIDRRLRLLNDISRRDGMLDLLIFTPQDPAAIADTLARVMTRSLDSSAHLIRLRGTWFELLAHPPTPLEIDGDVWGSTPARFDLRPLAIEVIGPRLA